MRVAWRRACIWKSKTFKILVDRYHNGYFNLEETLNNESTIEDSYDYYELQDELLYKVYNILLTKYNNYNNDDLNSKYTDLLTEDNTEQLKKLEIEQLKDLIKDVDNEEPFQYINKNNSSSDSLMSCCFFDKNPKFFKFSHKKHVF